MSEPLSIKRRQLLKKLGTTIAVLPLIPLNGCFSSGGGNSNSGSSDTDTDNSDDSDENTTDWLSGGTSAMEVAFPPATDPFDSGLGNYCTITDDFTVGPCYFGVDDARDDISDGQPGVPMTLVLKLVDSNCEPIAGGVIEVWWCNWNGVYSGDDSENTTNVSEFNSGFCTGGDSDALAARWFRGIKTTDNNGNVYFKACFPGWYPSRTTHIHFRIVVNATQQLISQFGFDDDLSNDIYLNHPDYTGVAKDTNNDSDSVFPSTSYDAYLFEVERQSDGSMLAYKAVQINV